MYQIVTLRECQVLKHHANPCQPIGVSTMIFEKADEVKFKPDACWNRCASFGADGNVHYCIVSELRE